MTDYERSLRTALVDQFPTAKPIGCWFHHNRVLYYTHHTNKKCINMTWFLGYLEKDEHSGVS